MKLDEPRTALRTVPAQTFSKRVPALKRLDGSNEKYDSIGKIRQVIKEELEDDIAQTNRLAKTILMSRSKAKRLDELLQSDS